MYFRKSDGRGEIARWDPLHQQNQSKRFGEGRSSGTYENAIDVHCVRIYSMYKYSVYRQQYSVMNRWLWGDIVH